MTTKPTPVAWALQGTTHIEAGEKRDYHDGQEWCALYDGAAIEAAVAAERERADCAEAALAELVALKRLKAGIEAADHPMPAEQREYESRKPAAWAAAFALVDAAVARQYGGQRG